MTYQAVGDSKGYRECASRYEAIASQLKGLSNFTVLDVGAAEGYFALRLAREFGAFVTAFEPRLDAPPHSAPRVVWVRQKATPEGLAGLGQFDFVLALSLLHHVPDWRGMLRELIGRASRGLFVETPNPRERLKQAINRYELGEIERAIKDAGGVLIGTSPGVWDQKLMRGLYRISKAP